MQFLFIIIGGILGYYYFLYRNKFDIFTLAFLCCEFYFMPGFFGFTTRVFDDRSREYIKCSNQIYYVFILVLLWLFIFTLLNDKRVNVVKYKKKIKINTYYVANICSIILIVIISMFLLIDGKDVFGKSKLEYIEQIGVIYQIMRYLIPLVFGFAIMSKSKLAYIISVIGLSIDLYMSNRTVLLLCIMIIILVYIYTNEKKYICNKYKKIFIILPIICGMFFIFERVIEPIQKKDWTEFNRRILSVETYIDSVIVSEPFVTQTILEEVIKTQYTLNENTIVNLLNNKNSTFNDKFQADLFPTITRYKMAENIWAEVYSNYKMLGVMIMSVIYSFIIYILNIFILKFRGSIYMPYLFLVSANWIFFIHRGSVINQFLRQKNIFLVFSVCLISSYTFNMLSRKLKLWIK